MPKKLSADIQSKKLIAPQIDAKSKAEFTNQY